MWELARKRTATPSWAAMTAALAFALSACGGNDGGTPVSGPPGATPPPPATGVKVDSLAVQTQANTRYQVNTPLSGTVVLTLPLSSSLSVGDTVSVTGVSSNAWRIAQNPGQLVDTTALPGDPQPADLRHATGQADAWWTAGASADGQTLLAAGNAGNLYLSRDSGDSWTQAGPYGSWSSAVASADGTHLAATRFNGRLWISHDRGATWSAPDDVRQWLSITVSDDGQHLAAVVKNGRIYTSGDGGRTWIVQGDNSSLPALAGPTNWQSIAGSADGKHLLAGVASGRLYTSDDYGVTWTPHESERLWYRVASSGDGMRLAAADSGGFVYLSSDAGQTWTPRFRQGPVNALAMSRDGMKLILARPNEPEITDARIHVSTDGGQTWTAHLDEHLWRGVAISGDGNLLLAADLGSGGGITDGKLYISRGHRTSTGIDGSIDAHQGDSLELQYTGFGRFSVHSTSGGPFSVR